MRVVAQRPSLKARRNVSACCPNNGQRVAVGRKGGEKRVHEEYHSRLTFLFKTGAPFCLSPLRSASTIFVLKPRVMFLSNIYPLPSPLFLLQSSCFSFFFFFFFASQACCSTKIASPFVGGAVQTGVVYMYFLGFDSDDFFLSFTAALINKDYSPRSC